MDQQSGQKPPDIKEIMSDYDKAVKFLSSTPAEAWEALGQKTAMNVFNKAHQETEAYKLFLKSYDVDSKSISDYEDFIKLPVMDKDNYVKKYGFTKINTVKPGDDLYSFSLSSGTTDKPTVWPRYYAQEEGYVSIFGTFMRLYWNIDKRSTLAINAFNLGVWTSGIAVNIALRPLTQKYKMTLATTGSDLDNIVETVKQLSDSYDQTIIFSYPTFIRSVLDRLEEANINLRKLNLKIFTAGESNTVEWKQFISKLATGDHENLTFMIDGYGTTDLGLLAVGSSLTNLIRDLAYRDKALREDLFGKSDSIPTLFQYNPASIFIEKIGEEPYFTSSSATPLVRYNLHDRGGVIKFREMEAKLANHGYDYKRILNKKGLSQEFVWQQPFIYCFGRRDDTVIIGGGNVFPEQIAPALFNSKDTDIHSFKIGTVVDDSQHLMMQVLLELKENASYNKNQILGLERKYHNIILKHLLNINSDYAIAYRSDPKYCDPIVKIYECNQGPFLGDDARTKPKLVIK